MDVAKEERERLIEIMKTSVLEIDWGKNNTRIRKALMNHEITTLFRLVQRTDRELLKYWQFGQACLNDVREKVADNGLVLGMTFSADIVRLIEG